MSSYDKVVKLACKPKAAPPKAKYLDPIIAATWSEDGAVHDVCKALSPRFREPNAVVVFKALIVLHTMIRNGATDNVLSYLSSSEVLRLGNVSAGNWEGYAAPENLQHYARYLDSRIRAYRDLKHDAIRVQAESNRDMRNSASVEEDNYNRGKKPPPSSGPQRSKTIMGRKLRVMTVEKGLLRETRTVHRMIDALVECRFYLDDLEDELVTTALRMLVKDLLILFQAGNEGVINVLEHYFEMSHVDAEQALAIYRHFCKQTERVVEYLGIAKKLQNLLNVPVPNLKHAPVSLAGALEEYLNDPNFEQNRIEYKTNKEAAERGLRKNGTSFDKTEKAPSPAPPLPTSTPSTSSAPSNPGPKPEGNKAVADFFAAIEEEQPTMFNPQTNSPNSAYFQQQSTVNPFVQMGIAQTYGQPQMQPQPTGFVMPQQTAFQQAPNPFSMLQGQTQQLQQPQPRLQPQPTGHRPFSSFLPPQTTGFLGPQQSAGFLQAQPTGSNPFRQSILMPQTTGMAMFGVGGGNGMAMNMQGQQQHPNPFPNASNGMNGLTSLNGSANAQGSAPIGSAAPSSAFSPSPWTGSLFSQSPASAPANIPARPASTPLTAFGNTSSSSSVPSPPAAQPVKTHQTGTRNPFGPITTPPPPVPKQPTLMELAMGVGGVNGASANQQQQLQLQPQQAQPTGFGGFSLNSSALNPGATDMSSIASAFSFSKSDDSSTKPSLAGTSLSSPLNTQNTATTALSTQPTGATNTSSTPSISFTGAAPLQSQSTGFGGLKPFKPSSSFGASLLQSLPTIPDSATVTPAVTGNVTSSLGAGSSGINGTTRMKGSTLSSGLASGIGSGLSSGLGGGLGSGLGSSLGGGNGTQPTGLGALNSQASSTFGSGSTLGQGLRPQMTGAAGAANPFRASMFSTMPNGTGPSPTPSFTTAASQPTGLGGMGGLGGMSNTTSSIGGSLFGTPFNTGAPQQQAQQQQGTASLI